MMQKLNLTVGPVQPFIASARKTVDFWSGSFLLSYLMGKGINFIENNNGRIIGPDVSKDNLYQYIKKNQKTLPNIG
ncbi:MAG: type III-B CRISPR-associated protein Cas10/Cmr2, partial [Candidatus Heimdallarchaeota archaeon]|nr:type III-B CRISPR-associated protein Cas10/Cmr2 [Candidatus Heimdallarchaeota archaeon]